MSRSPSVALTPSKAHSAHALIFLSAALSAAMGAQIKAMQVVIPEAARFTALHVTWAGFIFGMTAMLGAAALGRMQFSTTRGKILLLRSLLGTITVVSYNYALAHGELTRVTLLGYSFVIFATLSSLVWLREKPSPPALGGLAIACLGLVILIRPDLSGVTLADGAALLSAVSGGLTLTLVRDLRRTESASLIYFCMCLFGSLVTSFYLLAPLASAGRVPFHWPAMQPESLILLMGICVAGTASQVLLVVGMRDASTLLGALISLAAVPLSALIGFLFFSERIAVNTAIGGLMVMGAAVYLSLNESKSKALEA